MEAFLHALEKYRKRVITAFLVFLSFSLGAWFLTPALLEDAASLLESSLIQTMVAEAMAVRLVLAVAIGAAAALFVLGFLWLKRPRLVLAAALLFLSGLAFGRFLLLPKTLQMLLSLLPEGFSLHLSVWNYALFCLLFELLTGVIFFEPIVVWLLYRLQWITGQSLRNKRKSVYLAMLILLAVLTPTQDALTLLLSMLPLVLLYELSALILMAAQRKRGGGKGASHADA